MNAFFRRIIVANWQRKFIALFFASAIWFLVNRSLNENQLPPFQFQESIALKAIHEELLPLEVKLPLVLVTTASEYEREHSSFIAIAPSDLIEEKNNFYYLKIPLYLRGASPVFLEIVKEKLALVLYLTPNEENRLSWSLECTDQKNLEEAYINSCFTKGGDHTSEAVLRNHFRDCIHQLTLFTEKKRPLNLSATLDGNTIHLKLKR